MRYNFLLKIYLFLIGISVAGNSIAQPVQSHIFSSRVISYQYVVKFVCGNSDGSILAQGNYFTAINVHNPTDTTIVFRKKVAVAFPRKAGPVSKFTQGKLGPDEALEIDCKEIFEQARLKLRFLKGFVVIESNVNLDVIAVYTAAGERAQIETMHMEQVHPRRITGCPDLVVTKINKPEWDSVNHRSVIHATIKNKGTTFADPTIARVIDPTTKQPNNGAIYSALANTPALAPGATAMVTFYLPYWVYNPDATLEVTADHKNDLKECDENNNVEVFFDMG